MTSWFETLGLMIPGVLTLVAVIALSGKMTEPLNQVNLSLTRVNMTLDRLVQDTERQETLIQTNVDAIEKHEEMIHAQEIRIRILEEKI